MFVYTNMNLFEEKIKQLTHNHGNVQYVLHRESVRSAEVLKNNTDANIMFTEAGSPYLTPTGKQKRTEIVFFAPDKADWRIECKSRENDYDLIGEIETELNYVQDIPEELYCLVLSDNLLNEYVLNVLHEKIREKGLNGKVWIGNKKQFKKKLKKAMS